MSTGVMNIEAKLEWLKRSRGLTQAAAARHAGISAARLSEWKTGGWTPNPPTLLKLARFYSVSCEYLIDDEIEEPPAGLSAAQERAAELVATYGYTVRDVMKLLTRRAPDGGAEPQQPPIRPGEVLGVARIKRPKRPRKGAG